MLTNGSAYSEDKTGGKRGDSGVPGEYNPPPSLHVKDRGVPSLQSSRSSSEDEMSVSRFCGEDVVSPNVVNLSWSMLVTAGFPPLKDPSREDSECIRSLGPIPIPES